MDEEITDKERLEVLMEHPDKLWIDASGEQRMYAGNDAWYTNPRDAVDDIVRLKRAGTIFVSRPLGIKWEQQRVN